MKIPKKIKVLNREIEIKQVPLKEINKDESDWGQIHHFKNKIYLGKELPQNIKEEVLFHEIFHAVLHINSDSDDDEARLSRLSNGVLATLKDNNLLKEG